MAMAGSSGEFLASLSISSLGSDRDILLEQEEEELDSILNSQAYLYAKQFDKQSVDKVSNFTASALEGSLCQAKVGQTYYLSVEAGNAGTNVAFTVPAFSTDDVFVITIYCLPSFIVEEDFVACNEKQRSPGVDFSPLNFRLFRSNDNTAFLNSGTYLPVRPALFNGEYVITVTGASGFRAGSYVLMITTKEEDDLSDDDILQSHLHDSLQRYQGIRVLWNIHPTVSAMTVTANQSVRGTVTAQEVVYYRFVLTDPSKTVTLRLLPLLLDDKQSDKGELEIFVTDKYEGLVAVTRENCRWYCQAAPYIITLLPTTTATTTSGEQPDIRRFVIGVSGGLDVNYFELGISVETLPEPRLIKGGGRRGSSVQTSTLQTASYNYFLVEADPNEDKILLVAVDTGSVEKWRQHHLHSLEEMVERFQIRLDETDGVHVSEDLTLFTPVGQTVAPDGEEDVTSEQWEVVIYLSPTYPHPNHLNYTWKAFGSGGAAFVIDTSALRYVSNRCYFSVFLRQRISGPGGRVWDDFFVEGIDPTLLTAKAQRNPASHDQEEPTSESSNPHETCFIIHSLRRDDWLRALKSETSLSSQFSLSEWRIRQEIYDEIFSAVHASDLSHKDREALQSNGSIWEDEQSLSYGEVLGVMPFAEFVSECGAVDGNIFYDLGCGVGKAVLSAALSGLCFLKCIGIEVLPQLAEFGSAWAVRLQEGLSVEAELSSSARLANLHQSDRSLTGSTSFPVDLAKKFQGGKVTLPLLEIRQQNILDSDWADGDIVFVASTCFSESLLEGIFRRSAALRAGAKLVTAKLPTLGFDADVWVQERIVPCHMTWGVVDFFVLRRIESSPFIYEGNSTNSVVSSRSREF